MSPGRRPFGAARAALAACLLLAGLPSLGATPLPPFTAQYGLSRNSFPVARATLTLTYPSPGHYLYRSYSRPTELVSWFRDERLVENSRGVVASGTLRPLEYHYALTGSDRHRHADLLFDWQRDTVQNTVAGHTWDMRIPPGTLDKLVVQLALMADLDAGRRTVKFNIADGGKLKVYRFRIVGRDALTTPAGHFDTVKVQRLRSDIKRVTYLWCAPALHYLPIRIEQVEQANGTDYRSVLQSVSAGLRTGSPSR